MSMSSHIVGFRKPDEKFNKMKKAYRSCIEAGVDVPDEVNDFFGWEPPNGPGIEVDLENLIEEVKGVEMQDIWQIEVSKIPEGVTHIRFVNSY